MSAPTLTRSQAVLQAGEELLQEWSGRVRSVARLAELRGAIRDAAFEAEDAECEAAARRERGRHWREQMPALAEAMATPENERWGARDIATMAAELGVDLARIDIPSMATQGPAAMAYITPPHLIRSDGRLHKDLGLHPDRPIPEQRIAAAAKLPGDGGKRARLALRLLSMAQRSGRR